MSKYVDKVKRERPANLYVFDLDRTALDGGTVSDLGHDPDNAVVVEDTGFAEIDVESSIIAGLDYSVRCNVLHDRAVNAPGSYSSHFTAGTADTFFGPNQRDYWTVEGVVSSDGCFRPRFTSGATVIGYNQSGIEGLSFNFTNGDEYNPMRQFQFVVDTVEEPNYLVLETDYFDAEQTFHFALVKNKRDYAFYVNGVLEATGNLPEAYTIEALNDSQTRMGGWNSRNHADCTLGLLAFYYYAMDPRTVHENYQALTYLSDYELNQASLDPEVSYIPEPNGYLHVEPVVGKIGDYANHNRLYEDENEELSIQDSYISAGATGVKSYEFDLSGMSAGLSTYFDVNNTTDANSSIDSEYSFDFVSFNTLAQGRDTIPELDAKWGAAV